MFEDQVNTTDQNELNARLQAARQEVVQPPQPEAVKQAPPQPAPAPVEEKKEEPKKDPQQEIT